MSYRRPPQNIKKYLPPFSGIKTGSIPGMADSGIQRDFISIPLPNEREDDMLFTQRRKKVSGFPSVINFLREHITIEEVILVGLIVLLLDESIGDDLLIIALVYILLF